MTLSPSATPLHRPGRFLAALGFCLPVLAVAGYAAQLRSRRLTMPWYLPLAATLGVILLVAALWRARTVTRWLALLLALLIAGGGWAFVLSTRLPAYTGPVAAGRPFPEFTTQRADGTPFTRRDLEGGPDSVLVFFRGRW
jgi:hypothetical protein